MIRKFGLPLLSQAEIFSLIKQFWWSDVKTELPPLSRGKLFRKNKAVLLMWLENLDYLYYHNVKCSRKKDHSYTITWKFELPLLYHELKCSKKYGRFYEVIWKFTLLLSSRGKIFQKIKQFCWSDSKTSTAPIITSWNFLKNKVVLLKWLENLNCPYYHKLKISKK